MTVCRNCIGMRFALLEAKLAIAKALRVVEFQRCEKTEVGNYSFRIMSSLMILISRFRLNWENSQF
jgi:cytochrome P450